MPRVGGINVAGVLLASLAFYFVGFVVYGLVFERDWISETLVQHGFDARVVAEMTPERLDAAWLKTFPDNNAGVSMGVGFLNALASVTVLAVVLRLLTANSPGLAANILYAMLLCAGFAFTTLAYGPIYAGGSMRLLMIDSIHLFAAYAVAGAVLSRFQ